MVMVLIKIKYCYRMNNFYPSSISFEYCYKMNNFYASGISYLTYCVTTNVNKVW